MKNYRDIRIYQLSFKLAKEVGDLQDSRRTLRHCSIYRQVFRSSHSVPANIAEGYAKKKYPKEFIRYLKIALGSSDETQCHIDLLHARRLLTEKQRAYFSQSYRNLSIRILNLINFIKKESVS